MKYFSKFDEFQKHQLLLVVIFIVGLFSQVMPFFLPHSFTQIRGTFQLISLFGAILIFLSFLSIFPVGIVYFLSGCYHSDWKLMRTSIFAIMVPLLLYGTCRADNFIAKANRNYNIARYAKVIEALGNYKSDQNEYPESLEKLIPKYIEKIPNAPFAINGKLYYKERITNFRIGFKQHITPYFKEVSYHIFYDTDIVNVKKNLSKEYLAKQNPLFTSKKIKSSEINGAYWHYHSYPDY